MKMNPSRSTRLQLIKALRFLEDERSVGWLITTLHEDTNVDLTPWEAMDLSDICRSLRDVVSDECYEGDADAEADLAACNEMLELIALNHYH